MTAPATRAADGGKSEPLRVCIVGSGTRFLSGISVYTNRLANALAPCHRVSVILMRQLLPARLYPGHARVGAQLDRLEYDQGISVFDGIDWFWMPSIVRAASLLIRERPQVVILQWWTGTVLHSYLFIVLLARLLGSRVIVEFHEGLDTAEDRVPLAGRYVSFIAPMILRLSAGFAFHAKSEVAAVGSRYRLPRRPRRVLPHGPHDHYLRTGQTKPWRTAPPEAFNVLFFGVIRPFKGLEDLVRAFEILCERSPTGYWLTVVGETWEGWTLPSDLIANSRWGQRVTFVNRYVHDDEVAPLFAGADVVALPYRRSAISGPVHVAMGFGKPLVVTPVGGLAESVEGYAGAVFTDPGDAEDLARAIETARQLDEGPYPNPQTWDATLAAYDRLFAAVQGHPG
jgi:glycosyltransferase involved in cell wall biosynthesis